MTHSAHSRLITPGSERQAIFGGHGLVTYWVMTLPISPPSTTSRGSIDHRMNGGSGAPESSEACN
jgi:hypothetical protein